MLLHIIAWAAAAAVIKLKFTLHRWGKAMRPKTPPMIWMTIWMAKKNTTDQSSLCRAKLCPMARGA